MANGAMYAHIFPFYQVADIIDQCIISKAARCMDYLHDRSLLFQDLTFLVEHENFRGNDIREAGGVEAVINRMFDLSDHLRNVREYVNSMIQSDDTEELRSIIQWFERLGVATDRILSESLRFNSLLEV